MPAMTKRVNINAPVAIRTITPPIYGRVSNIVMTTGDILKCLCKRATVDEILPDGSTVRLTMKNYYTDNGAGLDAKKVEVSSQPAKIPEVKKTEDKKLVDDNKVEETVNKTENDADIITDEEPVAVVDPAIVTEGDKVNVIELTVDPAIEIVSEPNTDIDSSMKFHEYDNVVADSDNKESDEEVTAFVTGLSVEGDESINEQTESTTTVASTETIEKPKTTTPKKKSNNSSKKKSTTSNK